MPESRKQNEGVLGSSPCPAGTALRVPSVNGGRCLHGWQGAQSNQQRPPAGDQGLGVLPQQAERHSRTGGGVQHLQQSPAAPGARPEQGPRPQGSSAAMNPCEQPLTHPGHGETHKLPRLPPRQPWASSKRAGPRRTELHSSSTHTHTSIYTHTIKNTGYITFKNCPGPCGAGRSACRRLVCEVGNRALLKHPRDESTQELGVGSSPRCTLPEGAGRG